MSKLPLGPGEGEKAAPVLRMFVGSVPILGPVFAELVTGLIPAIRAERVEAYLRHLDARLGTLSEDQARERLLNETAADLVEEGAYQAIRALTDERREQIATAVANGLSGDQRSVLQAKRMLGLLRELDDGQVIVLASKLMKNYRDDDFHDRHKDILAPIVATLQADQETFDAAVVQKIANEKLMSLGLITPTFKKFKKGETPEFDPKTGMVAASGTSITPLGKLLLRTIGLAGPDDH